MSTITPPPTAAEWAAEVAADDQARARLAAGARTSAERHAAARDTSVVRTRAEREAAIAAKRDQTTATARDLELEARRTVPASDTAAVDADPEVAELEQRVVDGDDTVTLDEVDHARTEATGRTRFAALKARAAERKAAEQAERDAAARRDANLEAARQALAPFAPARFAAAYDKAVAALDDLVALGQGHDAEVRRLATLPPDQRPDGATAGPTVPGGAYVEVDGRGHNPIGPGDLARAACRAAGVTAVRSRQSSEPEWRVNIGGRAGKDPRIVAEGRDDAGAA